MRGLRYLLTAIILLFGVGFACLNVEMTKVNLLLHVYELPLSLLLVFVLGIGMLIGFWGLWIPYCRLRLENGHLKGQLKSVEQEVAQLRMVPLKNND